MSDPREIAQRIADAIWDKCCSPPDEGFDTKQAIIEISTILAAEMPRWVPVEERMPVANTIVLLVPFGAKYVETGWWDQERGEWVLERTEPQDEIIHFEFDQVTHWQELPALPSPPRVK